MKFIDAAERQIVRLRPTLGRGLAIGRIIDLLPGGLLNVLWLATDKRLNGSRGLEKLHPQDVLLLPDDEAAVVAQLEDLFSRANEQYRLAITVALEYWLDLRRDGQNAQIQDLADLIVNAQRHIKGPASGGAPKTLIKNTVFQK
jgi:hypothetical protein